MDLAGKNVWQVAAGDGRRRYEDVCFRYQVMMIGPGERGPFDETAYAGVTAQNVIRRFYSCPGGGDVVLLRLGTGDVLAVGEVAGDDTLHVEEFGDIDGWRLQHCRHVRWAEASKPFAPGTFRGRFGQVKQPEVREWVHGFDYPEELRRKDLPQLPEDAGRLADQALGALLVQGGMSAQLVGRLLMTIESLRALIEWYKEEPEGSSRRPSEQETITYLVIPLLFSLGWSEKTVAIEWKNIDMALLEESVSGPPRPSCVVEAKSFGKSVFAAEEQAMNYAAQQGCDWHIVTDGVRYSCFNKQEDEYVLSSYLNIMRLRERYPVYDHRARGHCGGAVDSLLTMAR